MKIPTRLKTLITEGVIDDVTGRLMSGKEADVYIVTCGKESRCAKVYKEAHKRNFKKSVQYVEGRKTRNSRRARAMEKGSKYGRQQQEEIWQSTEVDALYLLERSDVRVPKPFGCFDGILLMELIVDEDGDVAPRLNDVHMSAEQALEDHQLMMRYIVRMLCAGLIHGDLSEFNILVNEYGPIIIDFPQVVNAAANNNAQAMLDRDIENMRHYYGQYAPELLKTQYNREIWDLYESGDLHPEIDLTGSFTETEEEADVDGVIDEIKAAFAEHQEELARIERAENPDG